jgi:hypothetical protein
MINDRVASLVHSNTPMTGGELFGSRIWLQIVGVLLISILSVLSSKAAAETPARTLPPSAGPNLMGIDIGAPIDFDEDRLYADVIRTSRVFKKGPHENSKILAPVDSDGWPKSDFSFYVWDGIDKMNGTYTLSFKGQAEVSANPVGNIPVSYDPATNTSTGTLDYTKASSSFLALSFTDTKRTSSDTANSGVTSIKLMRPLTPGASTSYSPSTLFTKPIKALISKFSVVRFMDFLGTNSNIQARWSDRALPSWASFNRNPDKKYGWEGIGGPWEHVILLSNKTGKDAWINIPVLADDNYVLNVARMFAFGSDGVNPYTSPQENPVYPPLNRNLKIYVEYSNELWNSGPFEQFDYNCQEASKELDRTSGHSPLNWDGIWDGITYHGERHRGWEWKMCDRHTTERSVGISNIFRSVFGDAAMITRIRPVLMSQLGYAKGTLFNELEMMLNYYDNMGGHFVAVPHPPTYYFYGAGGSAYYSPSKTVATLDAFFDDPRMKQAGFAPDLQEDAYLVAAMGLKRVAYEGGPSLDSCRCARDAVARRAVQDNRMTTAMVNLHNVWSENGGDLLVYYRSTDDYQWGFTPDIYDLSTPKLLAIDKLNAAPRRAPLTLGTAVPGRIAGTAADICSRRWKCSPIPNYDNFTADGSRIMWASYTFRSASPAKWTVNLAVSGANDAVVGVYIDGALVGTQGTPGGVLSFKGGEINPGLHGVIVRAVKGSFSLDALSVGVK